MALPVADPIASTDTAPLGKLALETNSGNIIERVPKGRKAPRSDATSTGNYEVGEHITILCVTTANTTPVNGDV